MRSPVHLPLFAGEFLRGWVPFLLTWCLALIVIVGVGRGQLPEPVLGESVPRDVREMYDRGLEYLAKTQKENGGWSDNYGGPGGTGLALMAFLSSGDDPNFGQYSAVVRKALRFIISQQNAETGYIPNSMYEHGFAMLALAEAYGTVDDRDLWDKSSDAKSRRSIGQALELAVRCAITSQKKNPYGGWRYSPDARDADTSVSGAVMVGLLAARNAGIEVPDAVIDKAVAYFASMTSSGGSVGYSGGVGGFGESLARSSIATLVFAIAKRKDLKQYKSALGYIASQLEGTDASWAEYGRYYQAQALFQGDVEAWKKWNNALIRRLRPMQNADGSFTGTLGPTVSTSMNLLALALNYRFLPIYER